MGDGAYTFLVPSTNDVIVHQNPCENEIHIAKLSETENKSELCA